MLRDYSIRARSHQSFIHSAGPLALRAVLESEYRGFWDGDLGRDIQAFCRTPEESDALQLLRHEKGADNRGRQERIRRFFSGAHVEESALAQRFQSISAGVQIDWALEIWNQEPETLALKTEEVESFRKDLCARLDASPLESFTDHHAQHMRALVFSHSEREADKQHRFGELSPQALKIDERLFEQLLELATSENTPAASVSKEQLLSVLRELEQRVSSFWYLDKDTREGLLGFLQRMNRKYLSDKHDQHAEIYSALYSCEHALDLSFGYWVFFAILALLARTTLYGDSSTKN